MCKISDFLCKRLDARIVCHTDAMLSLPPRAPDLGRLVAKVAGGLELKALCFAVAIAASVVPAGAGEVSWSPHSVQVHETEASRLYRAQWLATYARSGPREAVLATDRGEGNEVPAYTLSALHAAPAVINGRFRALVARVKEELRRAGVDPRKVRSRLSVRCTMKYASVKRTMPAAPMPVSAGSGQTTGATSVVRTAVKEVCACQADLEPTHGPGRGGEAVLLDYAPRPARDLSVAPVASIGARACAQARGAKPACAPLHRAFAKERSSFIATSSGTDVALVGRTRLPALRMHLSPFLHPTKSARLTVFGVRGEPPNRQRSA